MSVGAPGDGRTVLVVEDDHEIAELVRLYLVRDGYRVRIEHRGDTGLAAAVSSLISPQRQPASAALRTLLPHQITDSVFSLRSASFFSR